MTVEIWAETVQVEAQIIPCSPSSSKQATAFQIYHDHQPFIAHIPSLEPQLSSVATSLAQ
jgi:hypothetical protein